MIGSTQPLRAADRRSFADVLEEASTHVLVGGATWRAMILAGAQVADEATPPLPARRALDPLIRRAIEVDRALGLELDRAAIDYGTGVFDRAVLLGAALALTWPGVEGFDAWPERAVAHAGLSAEPVVDPIAPSCGRYLPAGAPPFEGETLADLLERSGSETTAPYGWLMLAVQTLWEESPHRRAFDRVDQQLLDLLEAGAPATAEMLGALDDVRMDEACTGLDFAARVGYALGKYENRPEPERVARAKALAQLVTVPNPGSLLAVDEWQAIRQRPTAPAPPDASAVATWLTENALADAAPAEVVARLLADPGALERLRPTPA